MLHTTRSNEGIALIAMIETPEGVENAQAIACVEGVDAVFVGPNDLAHAMGYDNNWTAPPVEAAIEKALRALASTGKCAGTVALTPEAEDKYAAWGHATWPTWRPASSPRPCVRPPVVGRMASPSNTDAARRP